MNRHLIVFCLTLFRHRDTIFKIVDLYYGCQDNNGEKVALAMRAVSAVGGNGTLDLAGTDRITESEKSYEMISDIWYLTSVIKLYATDNSSTSLTNSVTRQRLTGLGLTSDLGLLTFESVALDAYGNQTVSKTTIDRNSKLLTQTVDVPDSISNAVNVSVNGLMVSSQRSTLSVPTLYSYDALGRRTGTTDPRLGTVTTHYDSHGWVDYVQDAAGNRTTFTYNSATGRRISQTDSLSNTTYMSYSSYGQLEKTWGSAVYPVRYEYDSYGRMVKMSTYRNGTGWEGPGWPASPGIADTTEWIYHEASGLLIAKKDAAGKSVSYTYSAGGKLASRTWARQVPLPGGAGGGSPLATSYSYNSAGDLSAIDYSDSTPDVSFIYDRLGRQKTASSSISAHTFAYNGLLLATETIKRDGITEVINRSYDSLGRSTGFTMGNDYSIAYGYNSLGRFSSVSSSVESVSSVVNYSYLQNSDLISGLTSDLGPLTSTRSYEDHRNLLTQVKNEVNSSTLSQYDYANDAGGRRVAVRYSGTAFDVGPSFNLYGYNSRSEVQTADRYWGANLNDTSEPVPGQSFAYGYDPIGNRQYTMRDNEESVYTANNLNQYLQRTVPGKVHMSGSAKAEATVTVNDQAVERHGKYWHKTLDVKNNGKPAYPEIEVVGVYNPETEGEKDVVSEESGHIFVPKTPEKFTYDADGNMTQDGRFNYEWDCENRLVGVETRDDLLKAVPRVKVTFRYDYMGRRVMKHVSAKKPHFKPDRWLRTSVSTFLYDGWNLIAERKIERKGKEWCEERNDRHWRHCDDLEYLFPDDECEECSSSEAKNNATAKEDEKGHGKNKGKWKCKHKKYQENYYVWALDLSGTLQGAGGIGGLIAQTCGTNIYTPTADGNGNIGDMYRISGTAPPVQVAHLEYSPFGSLIVSSIDSSLHFPFRFSTKYFDNETSLLYYGYRFYNPSLGRFLSRDPIREKGFQLPSVLESIAFVNSAITGCSKCKESVAQPGFVSREIQADNPLYLFVNNNPVGLYDAFGLLPCPPGQIRDPKCVEDCQFTRYLEFTVANGAYASALFVCAFAPTPPLKLACITAATILYTIEVASIEKGFRDCIDGCPCACP